MSKSSRESNVILIAAEAIKNGRKEELDKCLKIMPVESLPDKQLDLLFLNFLDLCTAYDRKECARYVLDRWKVTFPEETKTSMITKIFMKNSANVKTLIFLISLNKDFTYLELMEELAESDKTDHILIACFKADKVFGEQKFETYNTVRDHAVKFDNYKLEEYAIQKINETSPFAEKPDYVKNYISELYPQYKDKLPKRKELDKLAISIDEEAKKKEADLLKIVDDFDTEEAIKLLTEGLENSGISIVDIDSARELLKKELSTVEGKRTFLLPVLKTEVELDLEVDRVLFWIYGPNNQIVNQNLTLDTPSAKFGGCRMFLCDLFDYDEEEGEKMDWFTGSCDFCLKRIKKRCYAARSPRDHGGWEGCFCSFDCVDKSNEDIEIRTNTPDLLQRELLKAYWEKVKEIGIQETSD